MELPENTTIETGSTGVLAICDCKNQRPDDLLLAKGKGEYLVQVERDGRVTNWYGHGVRGVTERDKERARHDEELYCENCENYIRGWLHHG